MKSSISFLIFSLVTAAANSFTTPSSVSFLSKTTNSNGFHSKPASPLFLSGGGGGDEKKPFAVIVQAEVEPNRMSEFLEMIENNAKETRKEPGCIRFDVLRSQDEPNKFFFYELYKSANAIEYHKQQPHYNSWAEFKASGGVISSVSYKTDGEFLT